METEANDDALQTDAAEPMEAEPDMEADLAMAAAIADQGLQDRLWLKAITPLICMRNQETDPSNRVQYAMDMMHISICERVQRIMNSDRAGG